MVKTRTSSWARRGAVAAFVGAAFAATSGRAGAHFVLQSPPANQSQDTLGSPQKLAPCGGEGGGTPSGVITAYQSGQTITITINEKIFHPGHYRVSLGVNGPGDLPAEPLVTPGSTACGSAPIDPNPKFPVLADGMLLHTQPLSGPQSFKVTLPANVTCAHCTLQVLEFMSNHALNNPGGCYYHHCAELSISGAPTDGGGPVADASAVDASPQPDAGGDPVDSGAPDSANDGGIAEGSAPAGCACSAVAKSAPADAGVFAIGALATALCLRRRRRST